MTTTVAPRVPALTRPGIPRRRASAERLQREELALHARITARDHSALLECVDRFGPLLHCAAMAGSGDQSRATAVTEGLFVDLWREPARFSPENGPMALQLLATLPRPGVSAGLGRA